MLNRAIESFGVPSHVHSRLNAAATNARCARRYGQARSPSRLSAQTVASIEPTVSISRRWFQALRGQIFRFGGAGGAPRGKGVFWECGMGRPHIPPPHAPPPRARARGGGGGGARA